EVVEQLARVFLAHKVGDPEAADARPVRRDSRVLHPAAVGIAEEIVAGRDRLVHPGGVDADVGALRLTGLVALRVARGERERGYENDERLLVHRLCLPKRGPQAAALQWPQAPASRAARLFDKRTV